MSKKAARNFNSSASAYVLRLAGVLEEASPADRAAAALPQWAFNDLRMDRAELRVKRLLSVLMMPRRLANARDDSQKTPGSQQTYA